MRPLDNGSHKVTELSCRPARPRSAHSGVTRLRRIVRIRADARGDAGYEHREASIPLIGMRADWLTH
jgi:hypothetical protein